MLSGPSCQDQVTKYCSRSLLELNVLQIWCLLHLFCLPWILAVGHGYWMGDMRHCCQWCLHNAASNIHIAVNDVCIAATDVYYTLLPLMSTLIAATDVYTDASDVYIAASDAVCNGQQEPIISIYSRNAVFTKNSFLQPGCSKVQLQWVTKLLGEPHTVPGSQKIKHSPEVLNEWPVISICQWPVTESTFWPIARHFTRTCPSLLSLSSVWVECRAWYGSGLTPLTTQCLFPAQRA